MVGSQARQGAPVVSGCGGERAGAEEAAQQKEDVDGQPAAHANEQDPRGVERPGVLQVGELERVGEQHLRKAMQVSPYHEEAEDNAQTLM